MMKLAEMCPFVVLCLSEDELKSVYSAVGSLTSFTISSLHHLVRFKEEKFKDKQTDWPRQIHVKG